MPLTSGPKGGLVRRWRTPRLTTTLSWRMVLFALLALLPVFVVVLLLEEQLRVHREQEVRDLVERQTAQGAAQMERLVESQRTLLTAIISAPSVRTFDRERCSAYLASLKESLPHLTAIIALDLTGEPRCTDDPERRTVNYADRGYFKAALEQGGFVVGHYTIGRADPSVRLLPIAAPIRSADGSVVGVAVAGLRLSHLQSIVGSWRLPPNGSLTIADDEGTILARSPLPERFVGTSIPQDFVQRFVRGPAPGVEEVLSQDGTRRIIAYVPATSSPSGIYVSSGYGRDEALAAIDDDRWMWNVALLLVGIGGAVATSFGAANVLIRRPVDELLEIARGWAVGEPKRERKPIATAEFETLAVSLDTMGTAIGDRSREAARQQELLLLEMNHRMKNLLAMVQAIGVQTARSVNAPPEFSVRFVDRIQALSRTTGMLTQRSWDGLDIRRILEAEVAASPRPEAVTLRGPAVELPAQLSVSMALIAHELATNAAKYGCLSHPAGRLEVEWNLVREDDRDLLEFQWRERSPIPVSPTGGGTGFGSKLIRRLVDSVGSGGSEMEPEGLVFRMRATLQGAQASEETTVA